MSTAKNADWTGDARLTIAGRSARLIDEANGKQYGETHLCNVTAASVLTLSLILPRRLASWTVRSDANLSPEKTLTFGGVQIQVCRPRPWMTECGIIDDSLQIQELADGGASHVDNAKPASSSKRTQCTPQAPLLLSGTRSNAFRPPAPAKAVNPLARQFAARSASPAPIPARHPREPSLIALPAAAAVDFFGKPRLAGSGARKPGPLFDPAVEGALVLRRPDEAHQAEYNQA